MIHKPVSENFSDTDLYQITHYKLYFSHKNIYPYIFLCEFVDIEKFNDYNKKY